GTFLGAWISRPGNTVGKVERELAKLDAAPVGFLRENGRFLAPNGAGDAWAAAVVHVRNWLSMLVVIGTLSLAMFAAGEALKQALNLVEAGWGGSTPENAGFGPVTLSWVYASAESGVEIAWSPFWRFAKWALLLGALPFALAYWLVFPIASWPSKAFWLPPAALAYIVLMLPNAETMLPNLVRQRPWAWCIGLILVIDCCLWADYKQRRHARSTVVTHPTGAIVFAIVTLIFAALLAGPAGWFERTQSVAAWPQQWFALLLVMAMWHVIVLFPPRRAESAAVDGHWMRMAATFEDADFAAARSGVTKWLTRATAAALVIAVYAILDTLAQTLAAHGHAVAKWAWTLVSPTALVTFMQSLAPKLLADDKEETSSGLVTKILLWVGAGVMLTGALIGLAVAARLWALDLAGPGLGAVLHGQPDVAAWAKITGAAAGLLILSMILGDRMEFVNLSSLHQLYSARLARAYLGASNPNRRKQKNWQVTETVTGDQIEYSDYQPHANGGPLHFINVTVNETVSGRSNIEQRDRKGFSFAVGPAGLSVRRTDHALYAGKTAFEKTRRAQIEPIPTGDAFHVFGDNKHAQPSVEMPPVGAWVGMSGAAFTTGLGARTSLATSLLLGLFNVRLGYWWDSRIPPHRRRGVGRQSTLQRIVRAAGGWLPAQVAFGDEMLARFHGVGRKHWYLSDGGHFENTACYELIRRRVPFIICCDCGCDPDYTFEDVANLVRKARLDFGAEITFLDEEKDFEHFTDKAKAILGPLSELRAGDDPLEGQLLSKKHAALARVDYTGSGNTEGWLLLIKPTVSDRLTRDVLHYAVENGSFPQQTTMDQFFDEAQWESYRQLGWQIGQELFDVPELQPVGSVGWKPGLPPTPRKTVERIPPPSRKEIETGQELLNLLLRIRDEYGSTK
ncbi:MAG TPA: hypothetical protein VM029_19270, partial [Opitutaceae bacterium]|nr:hypothetical protein [Opitutaceae bacterium]